MFYSNTDKTKKIINYLDSSSMDYNSDNESGENSANSENESDQDASFSVISITRDKDTEPHNINQQANKIKFGFFLCCYVFFTSTQFVIVKASTEV